MGKVNHAAGIVAMHGERLPTERIPLALKEVITSAGSVLQHPFFD